LSKPRARPAGTLTHLASFRAITTAVLAAIALTGAPSGGSADVQTVSISGELRVFDGDTLEVGPLVIRLHGIDAPELAQTCARADGSTWPCGREVSDRLATLLAAGDLSCEALDRDRYGRVIARCTAGGHDVGARLVNEGLAWAFAEYSGDYIEAEAEAKQAERGIWQAPTQTPWGYREDRWVRAVAASPAGCPIKGNVNGDERIYHTPWSPYYGRVKMDADRGERWFCDEAEAQAAGWRSAQPR
jgi:endonuclease YncB( thermonuclease family)